jgi:RecA-family ATPase
MASPQLTYYHLPVRSDGKPLDADVIEIFLELDAEEADRIALAEAWLRNAENEEIAEPQKPKLELVAGTSIDKTPANEVQHAPYGKNDLGKNSLLRQPKPATDDQPWRVLDVAGLKGKRVPVRQWIVPQWLPTKVVTLHYADGGVGKTLLALQLMAACASGGKWCGLPVAPCKSVGLFSEDDGEELHARIDSIRERYGLSFDDLAGMCPIDGTGQDNTLVRFERDGRMVLTPRYHRLREHALDIGAGLVVIDTAATTFGGNEIDRAQVTAFVGTALTSLAQDINGAVLLNAHPSLSGIGSGDLRSGSTAWNNSCRSRWALTRPTDEAGKPDLRSSDRILTRQKANAASTGDTVDMRWERGVFVPPTGAVADGSRKDHAEAAFLAGFRAKRSADLHVSESSKAGNYAPTVLVNTRECRDFKKGELIEAMRNMLKRGDIASRTYRRNSKTFEELIVVADLEQEEDGAEAQGEGDATE